MAEIDIELDNDLIEGVKRLAVHHYGDSETASIARVIEAAAEMRIRWSDLVQGAGNETEEPIYRLREGATTPLWNEFWNDILRR